MNTFLQQSRLAFRLLYGLEKTEPDPVPSFSAARRGRVLGLWADAGISPSWKRAIYGQALHEVRLTQEAGRVIESLKNSVEGFRLVKGPVLSAQAWPQAGLRNYDDLDFRCEKSSLSALVEGLAELGYRVKAQDEPHRDNLWHFGWGLEFRHPDGFMIEVNHRMFPPHFPWPERLSLLSAGLWDPFPLHDTAVYAPVPALHLLLACTHAAWHGWERLGWMVDIAGLLVRHSGVMQNASALVPAGSFAGRALTAGCEIAAELFGPLPGVQANPSPRAEEARQLLTRDEPGIPPAAVRRIHRQLMRPDEYVCYTLRRLLTPGNSDFLKWSLSGATRLFYWPLRPLRCISK